MIENKKKTRIKSDPQFLRSTQIVIKVTKAEKKILFDLIKKKGVKNISEYIRETVFREVVNAKEKTFKEHWNIQTYNFKVTKNSIKNLNFILGFASDHYFPNFKIFVEEFKKSLSNFSEKSRQIDAQNIEEFQNFCVKYISNTEKLTPLINQIKGGRIERMETMANAMKTLKKQLDDYSNNIG